MSEKYAYQSHYNFSENRVTDARELEGLEAKLVNESTIEWRVKVDNKLGRNYNSMLIQETSKILSQNGLSVNIIVDNNALFTIELIEPSFKITKDGMVQTNGISPYDGNIYDGMVAAKDNPRTLAHELTHKAGQPHFWETVDNPKTIENEQINNTSDNLYNLMNSDQNPNLNNGSVEGTDLRPSQTKGIINHVKIYNENIERDNIKKN